MRRLILALLSCTALQAPAQYRPFLDGSQWYVSETGFFGSDYGWWMTGLDTTIGGQTFVRVLDSVAPTSMWVREDTAARKVWLASAWNGYQPRLLYDFGIGVGDTVDLAFINLPTRQYRCTGTQPLLTTQGVMQQLILENLGAGTPSIIHWAQGLGDAQHPFYLDFTSFSDPEQHVVCNYLQGLKYYDDGFFACPAQSPPLSVEAGQAAVELHAGIHAGTGVLWVDLQGLPGEVRLRLFEMGGREVWRANVGGGQRVQAHIGAMASGVYVLYAGDAGAAWGRRKIVAW